MMSNYLRFIWLLMVAWPANGNTQSEGPKLESAIQKFMSDPCIKSAGVSFQLVDLEQGVVMTSHDAHRALPPASTQKILVTAAALRVLGPTFRFKTKIGYRGNIKNDTLYGDLVIKGFGDPCLGSSHFSDHATEDVLLEIEKMVIGVGIKAIRGNIIADASYYRISAIPKTWPYQDMGNYYGAFCAALNFNDNQHSLIFKQQPIPGAGIDQLKIEPEVPGLSITSYVVSGATGSGDEAYIMGAPFQYNRHVVGTIPPGHSTFTIKGSLPDPAEFLAHQLKKHLAESGIVSQGAKSSYTLEETIQNWIGTLQSPELRRIVDLTNQKSINLFAEALGMKIVDSLPTIEGDWLASYWKSRGIDMTGCRFADFSGLTPYNALTAKAAVEILGDIYQDQDIWPLFLKSLAIAGETGTLRTMFRDSKARGRIYAKSGLINGVRSYAGYMQAASGKWYAFDIMTHNPVCSGQQLRKKLEHLLETLYLSLR